ncbi:MAG TPA: hypothetical protein VER32_04890 [Pyrinomonadaceae bacterium]|nr:hypothetical protein [Pyrinomonadaceae bacterium]
MSATLNSGRHQRRLPGLRFDAQPPPLAEKLPRMDVAVFVGFAASGPLHRPVVVEDAAQFESVFGADAALAWDRERGEQVRAHLGPAVRAFFRNGGRRCWVIRVAGSARTNLFPVAGLTRLRSDGRLEPAYARARSKGSWSDSLQAGAVLTRRPLLVREFTSLADFQLELSSPDEVVAGDLLRFTYDEGYAPLTVVNSVEQLARTSSNVTSAAGGARRLRVRVRCGRVQWLRLPTKPPRKKSGAARVLTASGRRIGTRAYVVEDSEWERDAPVTLDLALDTADAPAPGSYVRAGFGKERLWLRADDVRVLAPEEGKEQRRMVRVTGEAVWVYKSKPGVALSDPTRCEKLTFELHVRQGDDAPTRLTDLAFSAAHERFWSALPSDETLYEETQGAAANRHESVWREAAAPRFPLAGRPADDDGAVYFPVVMPTFYAPFLSPLWSKGTSLSRDGLTRFTTALFLDPALRDSGTDSLLGQADFIRYQSPQPRRLRGIHAALSIEEATIIAVPDAVHRGWDFEEPERVEAEPSQPLPHPEWWAYQECNPPAEIDPDAEPERGHFLDCRLARLEQPELLLTQPDDSGTLTLSWSSPIDARRFLVEEDDRPDFRGAKRIYTGTDTRLALRGRDPRQTAFFRVREEVGPISTDWTEVRGAFDESGALVLAWERRLTSAYVLEEATRADWGDASVIHTGAGNRVTLYGRRAGEYFYRVRATVGDVTSDWSDAASARVGGASQWRVREAKDFRANTLLEVHCSLLRMSAARGDLFALLSLPEHYREGDAVRHAASVRPAARAASSGATGSAIAPLGFGETRALSFGALYHPWLVGQEGDPGRDPLRTSPPCGAAAGVMARRTLQRGAWIAPANEPFRGVVALVPPVLPSARQGLQDAQVNLIRREPQGFLALSADTLSDDEDLRPINVRRLLILLRRLALRLGATYVFEPHSEAFRRQVKRGFEAMLGEMFQRGAFAGATPTTSFQVNTGSELNTPQLTDQGRFIVEIKVAPSLPLTFLTLRLVQTSDRVAAEER